jgi:hypothetical protein
VSQGSGAQSDLRVEKPCRPRFFFAWPKRLKVAIGGNPIHIEGLEWDPISKPFAQGNSQRYSR